jgi:hypothetical protein
VSQADRTAQPRTRQDGSQCNGIRRYFREAELHPLSLYQHPATSPLVA